jgi:hypothetical protein
MEQSFTDYWLLLRNIHTYCANCSEMKVHIVQKDVPFLHRANFRVYIFQMIFELIVEQYIKAIKIILVHTKLNFE